MTCKLKPKSKSGDVLTPLLGSPSDLESCQILKVLGCLLLLLPSYRGNKFNQSITISSDSVNQTAINQMDKVPDLRELTF